jgi:flavin-dependent dehydrogenase
MKRDVLIVGAGPAGSALAGVLGALGWDALLLERRSFPHHKVCGEFLSPEAQASLQGMGVYPAVTALKPAPVTQAKLVSRAGVTVQTALPGCAWGISRFALDAALATAAQQRGAELRTGVTATAIHQTDKGFEVILRSRHHVESIQTRAVIAACGRYSLPGLPPYPDPSSTAGWFDRSSQKRVGYIGIKCHYEQVAMPPQVELFFFPGGYVGVNPIEGGRVNLCLLVTPAALDRAGQTISGMQEAIATWNPALGRRLAGGQALPETEVAVAPVDTHRPASPWAGVACLGDTAVMIPPLCGDGMAMALRSAELCAPLAHDFLRGKLSLVGWRAAYQANWHADFDQPVRLGRVLQTVLNLPLLADVFMSLGHLAPFLVTTLFQATRSARARPLESV